MKIHSSESFSSPIFGGKENHETWLSFWVPPDSLAGALPATLEAGLVREVTFGTMKEQMLIIEDPVFNRRSWKLYHFVSIEFCCSGVLLRFATIGYLGYVRKLMARHRSLQECGSSKAVTVLVRGGNQMAWCPKTGTGESMSGRWLDGDSFEVSIRLN